MGMSYQVRLTPEALDELSQLDRTVAQRILSKIKWLSENFESLTPEILTGGDLTGFFKLRVGNYRVIYTTTKKNHTITIHLLSHRSDIYKT
jgi:mRNA interferase RelE/StbE